MAGKYAIVRLGPNRVMGLASGADGPRVRDGAGHRFPLDHWPAADRVIRADSLYFAQSAVFRHLGWARAAGPQRLHAMDDQADPICRGRRVPAEVLIGYCRHDPDVVLVWDRQAGGRLMGSKEGRLFARS